MCESVDTEFCRLESLYQTAGDPTLSREAWLTLVDLNDQWSEFVRIRGALHKNISARGLPTPRTSRARHQRFPAVQQDGTDIRAVSRIGVAFFNEAGVVRGYDVA
jgi:hypothetical protein